VESKKIFKIDPADCNTVCGLLYLFYIRNTCLALSRAISEIYCHLLILYVVMGGEIFGDRTRFPTPGVDLSAPTPKRGPQCTLVSINGRIFGVSLTPQNFPFP